MSNEAIESVTATLEQTSISSPAANEADAAHVASATEGRRLYIGNLAYPTTEEQLKEFFQGYSVESVSIPTYPRTGRAVGYAFVDLHTKEDADRAIAELSGHEVLERRVSVQAARKPRAQAVNRDGEGAPERKRKFGGRRRNRTRGGFKNRGNREGGTTPEEVSQPSENAEAPATATTTAPKEGSVKKEATTASTAPASEPQRGFRPRRRRGPPEDGVPSKTKVMVANLPYELSEETLKEIFAQYSPESAKIALRPIRPYMVRILAQRGEPRKGRGFGFVTLASEEMQQKAIAEMNGHIVEGREIAVKVAIDNPKLEGEAVAKTDVPETSGGEEEITTHVPETSDAGDKKITNEVAAASAATGAGEAPAATNGVKAEEPAPVAVA